MPQRDGEQVRTSVVHASASHAQQHSRAGRTSLPSPRRRPGSACQRQRRVGERLPWRAPWQRPRFAFSPVDLDQARRPRAPPPDESVHHSRALERTIPMATSHARGSGGLSVGAGRDEQPRGRQAVALLRLSASGHTGRTISVRCDGCFGSRAAASTPACGGGETALASWMQKPGLGPTSVPGERIWAKREFVPRGASAGLRKSRCRRLAASARRAVSRAMGRPAHRSLRISKTRVGSARRAARTAGVLSSLDSFR